MQRAMQRLCPINSGLPFMFLHTKTIALTLFLYRRHSDLSCLLIHHRSPRFVASASPPPPLLLYSRLHPPWIRGTALMLPMHAWRASSSMVFSVGGPMWRSGLCLAARRHRRRPMATSSPLRSSTSTDSRFLLTRSSRVSCTIIRLSCST